VSSPAVVQPPASDPLSATGQAALEQRIDARLARFGLMATFSPLITSSAPVAVPAPVLPAVAAPAVPSLTAPMAVAMPSMIAAELAAAQAQLAAEQQQLTDLSAGVPAQ
jgi:hypothetical protein